MSAEWRYAAAFSCMGPARTALDGVFLLPLTAVEVEVIAAEVGVTAAEVEMEVTENGAAR